MKVKELKKVEQESKTMEKFVHEFRKVARKSGYKKRILIEKFKKGKDRVIRRKLMEAEQPLRSIQQWYKRAVNLDRYQRESRWKEERLKGKKEIEA